MAIMIAIHHQNDASDFLLKKRLSALWVRDFSFRDVFSAPRCGWLQYLCSVLRLKYCHALCSKVIFLIAVNIYALLWGSGQCDQCDPVSHAVTGRVSGVESRVTVRRQQR